MRKFRCTIVGEPLNHIHQDTKSARLIAVCKRTVIFELRLFTWSIEQIPLMMLISVIFNRVYLHGAILTTDISNGIYLHGHRTQVLSSSGQYQKFPES